MQIYQQQYFPCKCNFLSATELLSYVFVLLFLRIDVGKDVNDDVKSLLEIFLIQFVGETLLSSSTGFL